MEVEKINKVIDVIFNHSESDWNGNISFQGIPYTKVQETKSSDYHLEEQDKVGKRTVVFDTTAECGYFTKVKLESDSYGSERGITGIQFCTPIKKEVTVYE